MKCLIDPHHLGSTEKELHAVRELMAKYGVGVCPPMVDDEAWPMSHLFDGTCTFGEYAAIVDMIDSDFPGFYGIPRVDMNATSEQRRHAHALQYPVAYFSQHLFPDCSVDGVDIAPDLTRLQHVIAWCSAWRMLDKTIAVAKPWKYSTMLPLDGRELNRYKHHLYDFPAAYLWMPGRRQWRIYDAMLESEAVNEGQRLEIVKAHNVFGGRYRLPDGTNNMAAIFADSLAEAETVFAAFAVGSK